MKHQKAEFYKVRIHFTFSPLCFVLLLLPNILKAKSTASQQKNKINVADYGAKGNGVADDSEALIRALNNAVKFKRICVIPKTNSFYKVTKTIHVSLNANQQLTIESNGAVIKPVFESKFERHTIFPLVYPLFDENSILSIGFQTGGLLPNLENAVEKSSSSTLNISGLQILGPDKNFPEVLEAGKDQIWVGIQTSASELHFQNISIFNIYGFGVLSYGAQKAIVDNLKCISVGGRGKTTMHYNVDNDGFGDGIYFTHVRKNGSVEVKNSIFQGYAKMKKRSRVGITFENNYQSFWAHVRNCSISKYGKSIHVEHCPQMILNIDECDLRDFNYGIAAIESKNAVYNINRSRFLLTPNDGHDGGLGSILVNMYVGGILQFNDCDFDLNTNHENYISIVGAKIFKNCRFNGNKKNPFFADETTLFDNCNFINFGGKSKTFYSIGKTSFTIKKSKFINSGLIFGEGKDLKLEFINSSSSNKLIPKNR